MKYNRKTGRLTFEVKNIVNYAKLRLTKDVKAKANKLYAKRPGPRFFRRLGRLRKVLVYGGAACVMTVLVYGSVSALDLRFAKEAIIDGQPIGLVQGPGELQQMMTEVEDYLASVLDEPVTSPPEPVYITRLIMARDLTDNYTLRQNLLSRYDHVVSAWAIYADDQLLCAAQDETSAQQALEQIKAQYPPQGQEGTVEFVQTVRIAQEQVPVSYLRTGSGLIDALTVQREGTIRYTAQEGDTLWSIAGKFQTSVDQLLAQNPSLGDIVELGDELAIKQYMPAISVRTVYTSDTTQAIACVNQEIADDSLAAGTTQIVEAGVDGQKHVIEDVVAVNGEVVARKVTYEEVLKQPVAGTVKVGTRVGPKTGTGSYVRPVGGTVTSRFGSRRSGNHTGIDYAIAAGTPVQAADDGVVSKAEWSGGYGNLVVIDHGNGVETYYAHNSELCVTVGQQVSKGDTIAKVGSTGNSTGPHCHFEIRVNGQPQNPETYVN